MNRSIDLEGVHCLKKVMDFERASPGSWIAQISAKNNELLRGETRWPFEFMVFSLFLWVRKGRTDVSERFYIDLEGVHGAKKAIDLERAERARLLDRPDFSQTMRCCGGRQGGRSCSWCFSTAYGYRKGGKM